VPQNRGKRVTGDATADVVGALESNTKEMERGKGSTQAICGNRPTAIAAAIKAVPEREEESH